MGKVRHKKELFDGCHQPIVDQSLFDEVQKRKKQNRHRKSATVNRLSNNPHLLTGLLRCHQCGTIWWSQRQGTREGTYNKVPDKGLEHPCRHTGKAFNGQVFDDQAGLSKERYDLINENAEAEIAILYIPQIDDAVKASQLVTYLGTLWASASAGQRNRLLRSVLDAIYVDLGSREIVGLRPRRVSLTLFEAIENNDAVTLSSNPTGHFGRGGGDGERARRCYRSIR